MCDFTHTLAVQSSCEQGIHSITSGKVAERQLGIPTPTAAPMCTMVAKMCAYHPHCGQNAQHRRMSGSIRPSSAPPVACGPLICGCAGMTRPIPGPFWLLIKVSSALAGQFRIMHYHCAPDKTYPEPPLCLAGSRTV